MVSDARLRPLEYGSRVNLQISAIAKAEGIAVRADSHLLDSQLDCGASTSLLICFKISSYSALHLQ